MSKGGYARGLCKTLSESRMYTDGDFEALNERFRSEIEKKIPGFNRTRKIGWQGMGKNFVFNFELFTSALRKYAEGHLPKWYSQSDPKIFSINSYEIAST